MTTDEGREYVRDVVRRTLGAPEEPGSWHVTGVYGGVPISFWYSDPPKPDPDMIDTELEVSTTATAEIPPDYPLYLILEPRTDNRAEAPRAPFFATLQGRAAPVDIVTRLLDAEVCDELRLLGRFTLCTLSAKPISPTPLSLAVSVPYWVERVDIARRMLDVLRRLVLALDDARTAADAAAGDSAAPYRSTGADLERLHQRRLAEIEAVRVNVDWFIVPWLKSGLTLRSWIIAIMLGVALIGWDQCVS